MPVEPGVRRPVGAPRALLAELLDALPDGVAVFDEDWTVVYVNPAGARLLDRRLDDLVGRNLWVALPRAGGTDFHGFLLAARTAAGSREWQGYEAHTHRWFAVHARPVGSRLHVTFRTTAGATPTPAAELPEEAREDDSHDRHRLLAEVHEEMALTLDTGEAVDTLAGLVVPRLADWAVVTVADVDGRPLDLARAHRDPRRLPDVARYLDLRGGQSDPAMTAALQGGRPVHLPDLRAVVDPAELPDEARAAWARLDPGACTVVPLRARGQTFGALTLVTGAGRAPHTDMDVATAVEVARRASMAIDNARLYGQQVAVASTLQRSLLTPPPQPAHLEIAVRYQPAGTNLHVGGDWYDAFQQPDGSLLLVIGDVVGHDVDAAAAMGQVRSIVRGIAVDRQAAPAEVLTRVDDVLTGLRFGTMATALIARVEHCRDGSRMLRWSSAGHLPPLLHSPGGAVQVLRTVPEMLLGTGSPRLRPRTDHTAVLPVGSTVLLYTDGLVEHGRTDIDDGIERLRALLAELGDAPLDTVADQLLSRLVDGSPDDDIALVAVRVHPEP